MQTIHSVPASVNQPYPFNNVQAAGLIGAAVLFGLIFDYLFYGQEPGLNWLLYINLIIGSSFVLSVHLKKPLPATVLWLFLPLLFCSTMVALRDSDALRVTNVLTSIALLLMIAKSMIGQRLKDYNIIQYFNLIWLPFGFIKPAQDTIKQLFPQQGPSRSSLQRSLPLIKGIGITIPALIIFGVLFSQADAVFHDLFTQLLPQLHIPDDLIGHIILVMLISGLLLGAWSYAAQSQINSTPTTQHSPWLGSTEALILLSGVNLLFLSFVVIQFGYFFHEPSAIADTGLTYAEYARRGFGELLTVSVLSVVLMWIANRSMTNSQPTSRYKLFQGLALGLIAQVFIIMVSALQRLALYEETFGFTVKRLFGHGLILWLGLVLLMLVYTIITSQSEARFTQQVALSALLFVMVMNILNPDAFIARKNIDRFNATKKLDAYYLAGLSTDATPAILQILPRLDAEQQQIISRRLYRHLNVLEHNGKWKSITLSELRAQRALELQLPVLQRDSDLSIPQTY